MDVVRATGPRAARSRYRVNAKSARYRVNARSTRYRVNGQRIGTSADVMTHISRFSGMPMRK